MKRAKGSRGKANDGRRRLAMKFLVPLAVGMAWTARISLPAWCALVREKLP